MYDVLGNAAPNASISRCKVFTTCVAKRSCPAQFYLNDVEDAESLLNKFAASETTTKKTNTNEPTIVVAAVPPVCFNT